MIIFVLCLACYYFTSSSELVAILAWLLLTGQGLLKDKETGIDVPDLEK